MKMRRLLILGISGALVLMALIYWIFLRNGSGDHSYEGDLATVEAETEVRYGIEYLPSEMVTEEGTIKSGESLSTIFSRYGIGPAMVDRTAKAADSVFDLRRIKAGNKYTVFLSADSLEQLKYFVYEHNLTDYFVVEFDDEGEVFVRAEHKEVEVVRKKGSATIQSSLWNAMVGAGMSYQLAHELEKLYQWTIEFFSVQEGDHFTVIYDDRVVEGRSAGIGSIWGAVFNHRGRDYYAIPFIQDGKLEYWDELGNSLRKSMLKAPLEYTRISSKFSPNRLHPVLKVRRPHFGVDYAAPPGTPVKAVADGTIVFRGWDSKGGGNTIKIRHSKNLQTGYLHLRGFAKGIVQGKQVKQGEVIGYVGSTGVSTGPHLDYRVWRDGKPIDPLSITSEPGEPIAASNRANYEIIRDLVLGELAGEVPDSMKVNQLDSISVYRKRLSGGTGMEN